MCLPPQNNDTYTQFLNGSGNPTVGCFVSMGTSSIDGSHPTREKWTLIEPLIGPDGYCSTALNLDLPSDCAYITEYCEHPEVAFRVLDLLCDDYMTLTGRWGKEDENWDYVENLVNSEEWKKAYPLYADYKFDLSAEATAIRDELNTYVYEKLASWAIGRSDVEVEWDSYLKELETSGLSRMLEIMQQGWK